MMWYPANRHFRAGKLSGGASSYWDDANIGDVLQLLALVYKLMAAVLLPQAKFFCNRVLILVAMGGRSHGQRRLLFCLWPRCYCLRQFSIAMGANTHAGGNYSTAMGRYANASQINSIAIGLWN